jgi:hypothetical protein
LPASTSSVVDVAPKTLLMVISLIDGHTSPRAGKPLFADLI